MPRALFTKTGTAIWMSHLDLMRVLQRSFRRGGMLLKHSHGYSPHPALSIVLPLSVGVSSQCELVDFELAEGQEWTMDEIRERLNAALPEGVRILQVYKNGRKIKELTHLSIRLQLEYDNGIPEGAAEALQALFARDAVLVEKKTKSGGLVQQNILEMISGLKLEARDNETLLLTATICAQNPTLNPAQISRAIEQELPDYIPNFTKVTRLIPLDREGNTFR